MSYWVLSPLLWKHTLHNVLCLKILRNPWGYLVSVPTQIVKTYASHVFHPIFHQALLLLSQGPKPEHVGLISEHM